MSSPAAMLPPAETTHGCSIRPAAAFADLDACVRLQQQTWGYPDLEVVPRNIYVLAQRLGGHVLCGWAEQNGQKELAGFAMAMPAHEPRFAGAEPSPYLHSHMLAVAPRYRNRGLGYALKIEQRAEALARGIRVMRWTFDPLVEKNAYFNLGRLGVTAGVYLENFYGRLGSALGSGLDSDRLLVEWRLDAPQSFPHRSEGAGQPNRPVHRIPLGATVAAWKAQGARGELEAAQTELRARFMEAFAQGLRLYGFEPAPQGGGNYLLRSPP